MGMGIPAINIRRSDDRLMFIMGIPIPIAQCLVSKYEAHDPINDQATRPVFVTGPQEVRVDFLFSADNRSMNTECLSYHPNPLGNLTGEPKPRQHLRH